MEKDYQKLITGTNIDPRSYLSTDYFNHFNEVVMLFGMLGDMPEMLEEIDKWSFQSYCEHFKLSGLGFAPLAIELYPLVPAKLRESLERLTDQMHMLVVEARGNLRQIAEEKNDNKFKETSNLTSMQLQGMIDNGGAIVHGYDGSLDQDAVNKMF